MNDVSDWWRTSIIDMEPGKISIRGQAIEELIGNVTFPEMISLMLLDEKPNPSAARLLEAALVAAVDHGPQAPSISAARMAVTCGLPLNNALASAVNMLGDVHGGAGEQTVELLYAIGSKGGESSVPEILDQWMELHGPYVPGFGHRYHKDTDPRAPRLMELVETAVAEGSVSGKFANIGKAIESELSKRKNRKVPMNIDGATAVIFAELNIQPPLARGLFCLSRSVGILAHAWEQMQQGGRNKGPTPPDYKWTYDGR